jgi:hypothetical protein
MRRVLAPLTILICTLAALSACGNDTDGEEAGDAATSDQAGNAEQGTGGGTGRGGTDRGGTDGRGTDGGGSDGGEEPETTTIKITFHGEEMTPSGERIKVEAGEPIDLAVTADRPGEIHVHSDPEQTFSYDEGTQTFTLQISRPGVVEVESHDLEKTIVQLEVS